jgi:hypothetical protein
MLSVYFHTIMKSLGRLVRKVSEANQQVVCTLEGDNVRYLKINVSVMVQFCEFTLLVESEIKFSCSLTLQTGLCAEHVTHDLPLNET